MIQLDCDDAVHAHSACAVTATVTAPPLASIAPLGVLTDTAHFCGDGLVETEEEDPHADASAAAAAMTSWIPSCIGREQLGRATHARIEPAGAISMPDERQTRGVTTPPPEARQGSLLRTLVSINRPVGKL